MPKSYSQDFREKVIKCVNQGKSCNAASVKFDIAANTVSGTSRKTFWNFNKYRELLYEKNSAIVIKKTVYLHGSKTRNKRKISISDKCYT
ncbi:IS630 family transposase [Orientia tsutsugamushi]|uniref:IS630 family transposase n=1 Tax=Orientia tsutsugamushi TaxID=784 RepID=A0A2R8F194_ORITS|nr:hypothetical protein [Orientia tsutsugamushi]SPM45190.1 IS630 family transposase [Orientia tsutsugamushi]